MRPFRFVRPTSLQDVIDLLVEHGSDAALLAGGTDLVVGLRDGKIQPRVVIDLKRTSDLPADIAESDGWLTIGATAPLSEVERCETVRSRFPALAEAASVVGSIQIRNRATLVGNVCNASPAADTVPVLAVYGGVVNVRGPAGERRLPVVDFIQGNRRTALADRRTRDEREHPDSKSAVRRCVRPNYTAARRRPGHREPLLRHRQCRRDDFRIRSRVAATAAAARRQWRARRSICGDRGESDGPGCFDRQGRSHYGCASERGIPPGDARGIGEASATPSCRRTCRWKEKIWVTQSQSKLPSTADATR